MDRKIEVGDYVEVFPHRQSGANGVVTKVTGENCIVLMEGGGSISRHCNKVSYIPSEEEISMWKKYFRQRSDLKDLIRPRESDKLFAGQKQRWSDAWESFNTNPRQE